MLVLSEEHGVLVDKGFYFGEGRDLRIVIGTW